ncbi:50S ribosomal protein L11 methyltransferase [Natranaerobius trueperi]|uniref:Ribosomal protein L11 methyltransferase n=1 Tax=Natranaerobius trueperi TaxID=759412 RepID=A0A226BVV7_9FIRM|nr:50S ribosomal protein L11 methyltransferase [Natranaerobius trueperi]OWZ83123.1 50S ribosomal protein L11 methyltransferase [Natranaerobius trueperi]
MKWAELNLTTLRETMEAVSNLLHETGAGGVVIEDPEIVPKLDEDVIWEDPRQVIHEAEGLTDKVHVKAYLPWDDTLSEKLQQLTHELERLSDRGFQISSNDLSISEVDEKDWSRAWKEHFHPVSVNGINIRPTWSSTKVTDDDVTIWLDPGMAFGTGSHPTTLMCASHLRDYLKNNDTVLDLGCGSGILSIVAAKLGVKKVYAYDIDSVACRVTKDNSKLNDVQDKIEVIEGDVKKLAPPTADVVLGNLVADIIYDLISKIATVLKKDGIFIGSGISLNKKDKVIREFEKHGMTVIKEETSGEWVSLVVQN